MAVQRQMTERNGSDVPKIAFRIGINVGEIIIIIDGDDIFGHGVNLAARVENECVAGEVYLSGNAFEQVRVKRSLSSTTSAKDLAVLEKAARLNVNSSQVLSSLGSVMNYCLRRSGPGNFKF